MFIGGVLPLVYKTGRSVFRPRPMVGPAAPPGGGSVESPLFREVMPGTEAPAAG